MRPAGAEKLLGGYAAGTLTPEERQALFAAALEDQQLYESLVREEPLRELLSDPAARANLLAALDNVPKPWYYRDVHPGIIAAAASAVVIVVLGVKLWPVRTAPPISVVSQAELPQPAKSDLPTTLLFQQRQAATGRETPLPAPPAVRAAPSPSELPPAINDMLAQSSARPAPPEAPPPGAATDTANIAVRPQAFARAAVAPAALAVRYTILKKLSTGEFAPVDPGQELQAGDETVIRLEPNESGFLYVMERAESGDWRPMFSERAQASLPYTVPTNGTFRAERPGPREFLVLFSRQPQNVSAIAPLVIAGAREQKVGVAGFATSVVSTSAPPAQVSFPITLRYK
jgi:hypothetical protein